MAKRIHKTLMHTNHQDHAVSGSLQEQIAALAHALWRERGCPEGSPETDWFQAERQIEGERKTEIVKVVRRARRAEAQA